jgi:hypothetical protein
MPESELAPSLVSCFNPLCFGGFRGGAMQFLDDLRTMGSFMGRRLGRTGFLEERCVHPSC